MDPNRVPRRETTYLVTTYDASLPCGGEDGLSIQVLRGDRSASVELFIDRASAAQDLVCSVVLTRAEARHLAKIILGTLDGGLEL